jgi:hypothetical protein
MMIYIGALFVEGADLLLEWYLPALCNINRGVQGRLIAVIGLGSATIVLYILIWYLQRKYHLAFKVAEIDDAGNSTGGLRRE